MNRPTTTAYDITHAMARINGIDLHYVLEGDTKAPTLVLINMASHNLTCWEVVLGPLLIYVSLPRKRRTRIRPRPRSAPAAAAPPGANGNNSLIRGARGEALQYPNRA